MTYPFTSGIQSNFVYGLESTVKETRVENGVNVVTSQHDACRTYESSGAGTLGTPAYTTVHDHMTTTYSGRPPYLVSAAANHTHFPTSNNLRRPTYLSIEQPGGGLSTGTSTTGLDKKQPDPCATSPPSTWPEAGTQTDPPTGSKTEPDKKALGTQTDNTPASGSKVAEIPRPETTEDIIASILSEMLPCPDDDEAEKKKEKVSGNNGAKTDDDKNIRQDKETQVSGFETNAPSLVNPSGRGNMRSTCGCPQPNRKVTFGGVAKTSLRNFNQLEGELNKWYMELEEIERVFINQAEETIDRDWQIFTSRDELDALYESLRVEIGKTDYIQRELEIINANRQEMEALVGQLENYYIQFSGSESWVPSRRKYIYDLFLTCNTGLAEMRDNLVEMCDIVDEERVSIGPPQDPVHQIVRIISIHLQTLSGIDEKTSCLCSSIDEVSTMMNQFKRRHGI